MRRRRLLVGSALAVPVLLVVGATAWAYVPPPRTRHVSVPPATATPEQVVVAYVQALDAHDCATAGRLAADDFRSTAREWCRDVEHLGEPALTGTTFEATRVGVGVTFDLTWRPLHDDGSMPEERTTWGYVLAPVGPAGAWRVVDNGVG